MQGSTVVAVSLAYLGLLFLIAWWGNRRRESRAPRREPAVYALGIAVYCTSWTFYGAVGQAAASGFDYLAIYVGPALVIGLGWPVLVRMVRIARAENVASISDFISARYGKSRSLAVLVTVAAVVGLLPYFALQLKAITLSFAELTTAGAGVREQLTGWTTFLAAAAMALLAVLFGVSRVNATEHRRGLMLAVAAESSVKLAAALLTGGTIAVLAFGGPSGLGEQLARAPEVAALADFDPWRASFWSTCILSALAFLCLPRQFHVAVIENHHVRDIRTAAWVFPAYLVLISLFVLPVAMAGRLIFEYGTVQPDTYMVALPLALGAEWLALVAFIGGLSAATGMIVVSTVALGTMLGNDVVVPLLLRLRRGRAAWTRDPVRVVLLARRLSVVSTIAAAYGCYTLIGASFRLTEIGLISFAAVAQFAPALLGGMVWQRANRAGATAGILAGFAGWVWTVVVPALVRTGWLDPALFDEGPAGIAWLSPVALGGVLLDPITHALLWSLGPNLLLFAAVSLATRQGAAERRQAERFVTLRSGTSPDAGAAPLAELRRVAARYVGAERASGLFRELARGRHGVGAAEAVAATERLLAGAIGSASARVVVAGLLADRPISDSDARALIGEASRAILAQHSLMRDTLEAIPQGVVAFDEGFRVTLWNRRFVELIDQPSGNIRVGTTLEEIVRYNEARGEYGRQGEFDTLLARATETVRRGTPDRYERRRPDGTVLEIETSLLPSGGFVAVYTDVTERHRAAAALREANETLEARIAERTAALEIAKAEAERANRGKTRVLAAAGHDLLQPLQAARLFLSALGERVRDPAIGRVDASLHALEHALGEVLEVAKLDSGVVQPAVAEFRIEEVLVPLGEEFAALAREHGLGFRLVPCSAAVRSDPALLRRILQNLLANAVRYTPRGRVLVGCRRAGDALTVEVWDTGPGIPEDLLREIFAEFRQLGGAARQGAGLGLGLAIVERLAGLLGHEVAVRSRPGRGSVFSVRLPLSQGAVRRAPRGAAAAQAPSFDGALVLVVENEAPIAAAMADLLTGWSCEVVTAGSSDEALGRLGGRLPDAVLTDYHLDRGATGLEAVADLRARLGPLPAAVITADRTPALRAAAETAGCHVLQKPVRPGALRALLRQLLAARLRRAG